MGANCCSTSGDTPEMNLKRTMSQKKKGEGNLTNEDLVFNEEVTLSQKVDEDLYSEFSVDEEEGESDEETDWETYERDVTFERKGYSKQMFKQKIIDGALKEASKELQKAYKQHGPLKIKHKDVLTEIRPEAVEYRHEAHKNKSGDIYIGQFRKGTMMREGRGLLISSEGYVYEGFWADDLKFGFGRIVISNGSVYQGEWVEDMSEGLGIYFFSQGLTYKGEWKKNKCHGKGFEKYADGSKFKGHFEKGEKSGKGYFKWADGKEYRGNFKKNNMDGVGEFKWQDGRTYKGDWVKDK